MLQKFIVALILTFSILNSHSAFSITKEEAKAAATIELLKEQQEKEVRDAINTAKRDIVREAPTDYGWGNPLIGAIMFLILIAFLSKSFFKRNSQSTLNRAQAKVDKASQDLELARQESIQATKNVVKSLVESIEKIDNFLDNKPSFDTSEMDEDEKSLIEEMRKEREALTQGLEKERPTLISKLNLATNELLDKGVDFDDIPKYGKVAKLLKLDYQE